MSFFAFQTNIKIGPRLKRRKKKKINLKIVVHKSRCSTINSASQDKEMLEDDARTGMNLWLCKRLQIPFQDAEHGKEDGNNKTAEVSLRLEPDKQELKAEIAGECVSALKANEPCIHLTCPRQRSTRTSRFNTETSVKSSDLKKCDSSECHRKLKLSIIGLEGIRRSHFQQRQELEKMRRLTRLGKSF